LYFLNRNDPFYIIRITGFRGKNLPTISGNPNCFKSPEPRVTCSRLGVGFVSLCEMPSTLKFLLCIIASACLSWVANGNVIGIDFGSNTMKVAIVQPGSPLEVVTNFQSKRKTPMSVTFYRGERMFGSDSEVLLARKPDLTFEQFYTAIGREPEHPLVRPFYNARNYPYELVTNETTGHASFKVPGGDDVYYAPEELVAMIMEYAKDMTKSFGGKTIKDCVLTIPSHFTQHERMALYVAADIADLRVLSLIEENTAAALHYGIDRKADKSETVLFYNLGHSDTEVSIVKYSSYMQKEAGKNKTVGQFEVVGKAWDTEVGGFHFDMKLADLLADRFNEAWVKKKKDKAGDIRDHVRPMTRLKVEARKIKEVLSANLEIPFRAEQLHDDVDINIKVSRADFEAMCDELYERMTGPIDRALLSANMTLADITTVELLGGTVRIPKVRDTLNTYFKEGKLELGQHLNGDEAMALGAAFRAANLSTAFRVRKIGMADQLSFGVSVKLENLPQEVGMFGGLMNMFSSSVSSKSEEGDEKNEVWSKQTLLYPHKSIVPSPKAKTLAFNHDEDILCRLEYAAEETETDGSGSLPSGTSRLLGVFNITGIADFAKEAASKGLGSPRVHLSFTLDSGGVVSLSKAEATVDLPIEPEPESEQEADADAASVSPGSESAMDSADATEAEAEAEDNTDRTSTETDNKENEGGDASSPAPTTETEAELANEEGEGMDGVRDESVNKDESSTEPSSEDDRSSEDGQPSQSQSTADETQSTADETGSSSKKDDKKGKKTKDKKGRDKKDMKKGKDKKEEKDSVIRRVLSIVENPDLLTPPAWSPVLIAESRSKLRALTDADNLRKEREAALNTLEAYIYAVKGKLSENEDDYKKVSTDEQRAEIVTLCDEAEEWLYDDGRDADTAGFKAKLSSIAVKVEAMFKRLEELTKRPAAVKKARSDIAKIEDRIEKWSITMPHITEEEKGKVTDALAKVQEWLDKKESEQDSKLPHEEPAFFASEVGPMFKPLLALYEKVSKKPKPPPPVLSNSAANSTDANNTSTSDDASTARTGSTKEDEPVRVKVNLGEEDDEAEAPFGNDKSSSTPETLENAEAEVEKEGEAGTVDEENGNDEL